MTGTVSLYTARSEAPFRKHNASGWNSWYFIPFSWDHWLSTYTWLSPWPGCPRGMESGFPGASSLEGRERARHQLHSFFSSTLEFMWQFLCHILENYKCSSATKRKYKTLYPSERVSTLLLYEQCVDRTHNDVAIFVVSYSATDNHPNSRIIVEVEKGNTTI